MKKEYVKPDIQTISLDLDFMILAASEYDSPVGVKSGSSVGAIFFDDTESLSKQNKGYSVWDDDEDE